MTDAGSTKGEIMQAAAKIPCLSEATRWQGRRRVGVAAADADLFRRRLTSSQCAMSQ